ncbi:hypothetical protein PV327_007490 [Microctonus hyperodae]|uniref:Uncharacterized protein n=1 Tax=Microctonus hyperodae TaxID=165561 RepID=A0AA39FZA2_MICHY|nr:hypothetical protein PV327_007490 [Microctonus hyperodae]
MLELTSFLTETFIYFLYSYCQFGLKKLKEHDNLMFNKYNNSTEQLQINLDSYKNTFLKFANSFSVNDLYGCKYGPISYAEIIHSESNISINHYNVLSHESNCSYAKCEFPVFQNDESFRFQIGEYHSSKPCYGKLMQCSSVDTVELYYASRLSSKYYEGLKFNEEIYGNINSSPNETHTISLSQWSIKKCDICICTCPVYPLNRNMYKLYGKISFMEETSDILNNAVVTNVKFVGLNNTVFMLIEQRPLSVLKLNSNNDENAWKPLSVPWSAMEMSQAYKNNTYGHIIHGNGLSYGEIHINTTILHLDDIILPFGHVVTGVKFSFKTNESNIIQIQVRATPYNFITNKLIIMNNNGEPTSFWITAESMDSSKMPEYQRKRMTRSGDIKYDLVPNQSILFYTSRIRNSGSQIVGPGFDTRLTTSKWPFPLRGVGITIKTYNGKDPSVELKTFPYTIPPIN